MVKSSGIFNQIVSIPLCGLVLSLAIYCVSYVNLDIGSKIDFYTYNVVCLITMMGAFLYFFLVRPVKSKASYFLGWGAGLLLVLLAVHYVYFVNKSTENYFNELEIVRVSSIFWAFAYAMAASLTWNR